MTRPNTTANLATSSPASGVQFPLEAFDAFMKGTVPRFPGQDDAELAAYDALLSRIGPCIVVAQGSGAYLATPLAAKRPDLVREIVAGELTAAPNLEAVDATALARVPQLLLWGDNLATSGYWRKTRATADAYAAALRGKDGVADVLDLPRSGTVGNTHQMMMDRNSEAIAGQVADWMAVHALRTGRPDH